MQEGSYGGDFGTNIGREGFGPRPEHTEGPVARTIEQQTAKLPSDIFLWAAVGAMIGSAALQFTGRKQLSTFVGQWPPAILTMGLYNKLVKIAGSH